MSRYNRRKFLKHSCLSLLSLNLIHSSCRQKEPEILKRPNILVFMSDNHYASHLGCYGDPVVRTPAIDRIAKGGVRFENTFCAAPSCTPARAGYLTGQDIWRLEEGANLWGTLPKKFRTFTDMLEREGYLVGFQGKGWGPGNFADGGYKRNPAGQKYQSFEEFLKTTAENQPWTYWYCSSDPHRPFTSGPGDTSEIDWHDVHVPPYLPDTEKVRRDMCDYYYEIQRFDKDVADAIKKLENSGQSQNTLIVITSDNGWMMPRGLANLYDFGTKIPLIISWNEHVPGNRVVTDFVNLNDLAPTFLELVGQKTLPEMTAKSLKKILFSEKSGRVEADRNFVVTARERHAFVRKNGLGYPARAIRTDDFLYIRNYEPDRWPAGDPPLFGDIDLHMLQQPTPTKEYMMLHKDDPKVKPLYELGFLKRPAEELFDLRNDPYQMNNVADKDEYSAVKEELSAKLFKYLKDTLDPRALGEPVIWDHTEYYEKNDFIGRPRKQARELFDLKEEYPYIND